MKTRPDIDIKTAYSIRGVCILLIILSHLQRSDGLSCDSSFGHPYITLLASVSVALFFVFSGFGLSKSVERNVPLQSPFVLRHISKLGYPLLFFFIIASCFSFFCLGYDSLEPKFFLRFGFLGMLDGDPLWFAKVIICLYIFLFAMCKNGINNNRISCVLLLVLIYFCGCILFDVPNYWYDTILAFPLGIIFSRVVDVKRNLSIVVILFTLLFGCYFVGFLTLAYSFLFLFVATIVFLFFSYFRFSIIGLEYIGKNSFCFYLFHLLAIYIYEECCARSTLGLIVFVFVITNLLTKLYAGLLSYATKTASK